MAVTSYKDLRVWNQGLEIVEEIYQVTRAFPDSEKYGLTTQLRRAAVSIPSNIAEGWGQKTSGVLTRHLRIALGSIAEVETQLIISHRVGYIRCDKLDTLKQALETERRMVLAFLKSINSN